MTDTDVTTRVEHLVRKLQLEPHPEGGYYREVYRARESVRSLARPTDALVASTHIYYLLGPGDRSRLHRIRSDELWHFYSGSTLRVHVLDPDRRSYRCLRLGSDLENGDRPFDWVPAGHWFGADLATPNSYALVGCTVAPGFEFRDFELADPQAIRAQFPEHHGLYEHLCG